MTWVGRLDRVGLTLVAFPLVALWGAPGRAQDADRPAPAERPTAASAAATSGSDPAGAPGTPEADRPIDEASALVRPTGDGRRTLAAIPKNFARGVVGVFSLPNAAPLLIGGGLALSGHALDDSAERALRGRCEPCGRAGATMGGGAVVPMVGVLFLAGRLAPQGTFRAASYDFAEALAVNAVWTGTLKLSLHRLRPDGSDHYSLPSGHSSTAFSLATVAGAQLGWKAGVPAYAAATFVALSRIESNKHYLSDVLAGATLGVVVGRTVTRVDGAPDRSERVSLTPAADAHGTGVGLLLRASW